MKQIILYLDNKEIVDVESLKCVLQKLKPGTNVYYDLINYAKSCELGTWLKENDIPQAAESLLHLNDEVQDHEIICAISGALGLNATINKIPFNQVFSLEHSSVSVLNANTLTVSMIFRVTKHVNETYQISVTNGQSTLKQAFIPQNYKINKDYKKDFSLENSESSQNITLLCDDEVFKELSCVRAGLNLEKFNKDNKWGYRDKTTGNVVVPCKYDSAKDFSDNVAIVKLNGKFGIVDYTGKLVVPCKYNSIGTFSNGRAIVKDGNLWGFLDRDTLEEVVPCKYTNALPFTEWNATIADNSVIDRNGDVLFKGKKLDSFRDGYVIDEERHLIDTEGNIVFKGKILSFSERIIKYYEGDRDSQYFCNLSGKRITTSSFNFGTLDFHKGLALVKKDGLYGFLKKNGTFLLTPQFVDARDFHNGYAVVRVKNNASDNKWGVIDRQGQMIFDVNERNYIEVKDFDYGFAYVIDASGRSYYINEEGREIIDCSRYKVTSFEDGKAFFKQSGFYDKNGVINTRGEVTYFEKKISWVFPSLVIILLSLTMAIISLSENINEPSEDNSEIYVEDSEPSEVDSEISKINVNDVSFNMIRVEHGEFMMGATPEMKKWFDDEKPVHRVTLTDDYYIGETEVTQALWKAVMGSNPSRFKGDNLPVEKVSWNDCQDFIEKLNRKTGKKFRLPTEAEWEFAARGGNKSNRTQYSGNEKIDDVAWYDGNSGSITTHPVKTKNPNELGIYDMSGNVWEWCQDWYGDYKGGSQTNPKGPTSGSCRVRRGGSWSDDAVICRLSFRYSNTPVNASFYLGFRLALSE